MKQTENPLQAVAVAVAVLEVRLRLEVAILLNMEVVEVVEFLFTGREATALED
jgi:hypothetical protein